jgi:hypothetical protein
MDTLTDYFQRKTRDDGTTFYTLTDDAPEWLRDAVYEAHDSELPNDWRYDICHSIINELGDGYDPDEIADGLVDVYNSDRAAWLADNLARGCIEIERDLLGDDIDAFTVIGLAQYAAISEMVRVMVDAIETNTGDE